MRTQGFSWKTYILHNVLFLACGFFTFFSFRFVLFSSAHTHTFNSTRSASLPQNRYFPIVFSSSHWTAETVFSQIRWAPMRTHFALSGAGAQAHKRARHHNGCMVRIREKAVTAIDPSLEHQHRLFILILILISIVYTLSSIFSHFLFFSLVVCKCIYFLSLHLIVSLCFFSSRHGLFVCLSV